MARLRRKSPPDRIHMFRSFRRAHPHSRPAGRKSALTARNSIVARQCRAGHVDSGSLANKIAYRAAPERRHISFEGCVAMNELAKSHLLPTYARVDLAFERGEGAWLVATNGERYLDFTSGVAVNALGHAHPHLVEAIAEQAKKLWHVSNLYRIPESERVAERLCAASFADVAFFCNSGAEAVECAIKMARKYHSAKGNSERFRIVTYEGAFHGRTLATLAAGGQ